MFKKLSEFSTKRVQLHGAQYKAFALFSIVNYPISFAILYYFGSQSNENLGIRLSVVLLSLPLLFEKNWPKKFMPYLPLYWHFTLLCSIPFFATFMLLENQLSIEWLMNMSLGLFWFILLVDWLSFIILLPTGIMLGFSVFALFGSSDISQLQFQDASLALLSAYMYVYAVILGLIFARNRDTLQEERQQTLKSAAGAIAHEMRTPLMNVSLVGANVDLNVERIEKIVAAHPELKQAFQKPLEKLAAQGEGLEEIAKRANILINTLLTNLKQDLDKLPQTEMSMKETLEEILEGYSFQPHEVGMVRTDIQADFTFRGNKELIVHIFYNLLKNSIYFVKAARKGDILITVQENKVIFKDTGTGVEKHRLKHLFTPFYSRRSHGTGIGLAFCKRAMESMGGTITVASELNEHTTFTLEFPEVQQ